MYCTHIPVMNYLVTDETREKYLDLLVEAKAERVWLIISMESREASYNDCRLMRKNAEFFRANGIEPAIWVGTTIGHGEALAGVTMEQGGAKQTLVDTEGRALTGTNCPFDKEFQRETGEFIRKIMELTGIKTVMLDDDYRLSQHGTDFFCACDLHLQRMAEILGHPVKREELKEKVFLSPASEYRNAWLKAQGDSMRELAWAIRREVDKLDKTNVVGICTAHSIWGVDGTTAVEIASILAGDNKPVARLHPAPYWATHSGMPLTCVTAIARMFAHLAKDSGAELIAEGDNYPRPRYMTPASHLELFDAVLRADGGYDGILKYMSDYTSNVDYEYGYFNAHKHDLSALEEISRVFAGGKHIGVSTPVDKDVLYYADLSRTNAYGNNHPFPLAARLLGGLSIPTTFGEGFATAVFGEDAQKVDPDKIGKGLVIDGVAAHILSSRGIDVGIEPEGYISGCATIIEKDGEAYLTGVGGASLRMLKGTLKADAAYSAVIGGEQYPVAYVYENALGQRFTVYLIDTFSLANNSTLFRGYWLQEFLVRGIEWISGEKLPVKCLKNPELYVIAKQDGNKLCVGLFNMSADKIYSPAVTLDRTAENAEFINVSGSVSGDTVTLGDIGPFDFCAFTVE